MVPPEVVLAALIRRIMQNSSAATDESSSAVVTVPGCYGQLHRRAIRNACRIAGVDLVQLLNKPLAAALHWLDLQYRLTGNARAAEDRKLLVVQLAGTGLDVSVVHAFGNRLKELGNCGHWKLGQMRWQHLLVQYFSQQLQEKTGAAIRSDVAAATRLQRTIEIAFGQLTGNRKVDVRFEWAGASLHQTVTQEGLLQIAPELPKSLQQSISRACAIAKIDVSEIDQVLLSGGMLLMKPLQNVISKMIPHTVDMTFVEKTDLALGAAIHAHNVSSLESEQHELTLEATGSASYDIALLSTPISAVNSAQANATIQQPKVVIAKGQSLPRTYTRTIRPTQVDGKQQLPSLQLIESSSLGRGNWLKLGSVDASSLFEGGHQPLQLRMAMDSSGILESSVTFPSTGQRIFLPPSSEPELSSDELSQWREWLEKILRQSS
jgi:molecular chaperone DnaK (HSP70)